jgi:imidazolonepropionase-like amidohydrolase
MKRIVLLILIFSVMVTAADDQNRIAIKAKKIVRVSGSIVENGTILIRAGRIEKVGNDFPIPSGYRLYDYSEYSIYPGIINLMTHLGISGISRVREWNDYRETGKYNPHISAHTAFYPWGNLIPVTREFGTLMVLSVPAGGIISGKAALVSLNGWAPEDMFIKREAALIIRIPRSSGKNKKKKEGEHVLSKDKRELMEFFSKAYKYFQGSNSRRKNPAYEAMRDIWSLGLPVIVAAESEPDIKFAIQLGRDFKLNLIIFGIYEGESLGKEIRESGFPVIVSSMYNRNQKWEHGYDKVYRLPAALFKAGIKFAFSTNYASTAFDLPIQAARAVAYGLPEEEALKALTLYPAQIMGLKDYGCIDENKIADLVVTDGDLLETSTSVKAVFIKGRLVRAKSFFEREYQRARNKISGEF